MKTYTFLAMCLALPLIAQEPTPQAPSNHQGPKAHQKHGEGKKGHPNKAHELLAQQILLEKFDTNMDGKLDQEERKAMQEAFRNMQGKEPRPELTEEEKAARKAKMMEKWDKDADGELSKEERQARRAEAPNKGLPKGIMHKLMLEKFDADGDGKLGPEERKAIHEAARALRPQNGQHTGPRRPQGGKQEAGSPQGEYVELTSEKKNAKKDKSSSPRGGQQRPNRPNQKPNNTGRNE